MRASHPTKCRHHGHASPDPKHFRKLHRGNGIPRESVAGAEGAIDKPGQLAASVNVDKSLIGGWCSGAIKSSALNLSRITQFVAARRDGFCRLDWHDPIEALPPPSEPSSRRHSPPGSAWPACCRRGCFTKPRPTASLSAAATKALGERRGRRLRCRATSCTTQVTSPFDLSGLAPFATKITLHCSLQVGGIDTSFGTSAVSSSWLLGYNNGFSKFIGMGGIRNISSTGAMRQSLLRYSGADIRPSSKAAFAAPSSTTSSSTRR